MTEKKSENMEIARQFCQYEAERLERSLTGSTEQLIKMSGWLTASLLAINGAGALATLNVLSQTRDLSLSGLFFLGGIVLALLSAVAIQSFQDKVFQPLAALIRYWREAQITGVRNESEEQQLREPINKLNKWGFVPPVIGWLSGFSFVIGALTLALGITSADQASLGRCRARQSDMFAFSPKRADSRELFVVLNCKVQSADQINFTPATAKPRRQSAL
jgi:hypothetical protein